MTRSEFINDLRSRIWNLPVDDVSSAIRYYDSFIADCGPQNEQAVLAQLGSPQRVADFVIREYELCRSSKATPDYRNSNPAKGCSFENSSKNNTDYTAGYTNSNQNSGYHNTNQNQYRSGGYNEPKRLYKSQHDKMITGVCAGIGEYFNIDPTLIRILAVIFSFTGAGFIAYLIAAVILPEKN